MKYYASQTKTESLTTIKIFTNEEDACSYARMLWNHLADSEKEKKAVNVYLVDTDATDIEYVSDELTAENMCSEIIDAGLYDEVVWDCRYYEHVHIAITLVNEIEAYMQEKEVAVFVSGTAVEAITINWICHELDEMDRSCGELTTMADKDWFLGIIKGAVDQIAEDRSYDRFADKYVLTYIGKDEEYGESEDEEAE